jgi:hypothetical protein
MVLKEKKKKRIISLVVATFFTNSLNLINLLFPRKIINYQKNFFFIFCTHLKQDITNTLALPIDKTLFPITMQLTKVQKIIICEKFRH